MSDLSRRDRQNVEWMIVHTTHNPSEAHIIAGRLQHEGIQAIVDKAIGGSALGITIGRLGEVRVLVHPADYNHALDILDPEPNEEIPDTTDPISYRWEEEDHDDD